MVGHQVRKTPDDFFYFLFVRMPKTVYKGQKFTKLVKIKMPATTPKIMAAVPLIIFIKYNPMIIAATPSLMLRSNFPIFGAIIQLVFKIIKTKVGQNNRFVK